MKIEQPWNDDRLCLSTDDKFFIGCGSKANADFIMDLQQATMFKRQITKIKHARSEIRHNVNELAKINYRDFDLEQIDQQLNQQIIDRVFIENAKNMSYMSHCVSRQVGCVIARDGRTLVTGINGTTSGDVNCDELFPTTNFDPVAHRSWSDDNEIHAELNAINYAARHGINLDGATLYCSLQPCMQCSKNLPAVGIVRVVFDSFYDRVDSYQEQVNYLKRKGVVLDKLMSDAELDVLLAYVKKKINKVSK